MGTNKSFFTSITNSRIQKFKALAIVLGFTFLAVANVNAQLYTGITFTEEEKALHLSKIDQITEVASSCLNETYQDHVQFFQTYGVSRYFGNRKYTKGWNEKVVNGRRLTPIKATLQNQGLDPNLEDYMTNMSCFDFAINCLGRGFRTAGLDDQWQRILAFNPDKIGNRMQHGLQALGWKILYWNPDPSSNQAWDIDDRKIAPGNPLNVWGNHEAHYNSVMRRGMYLYNKVDDARALVNFGKTTPLFLETVKFGVGTAHAGYHVFLVNETNVIEAHSSRSLFALDNLEFSPFNPLGTGGGPRWTRSEKYRSGIVVVPPNVDL